MSSPSASPLASLIAPHGVLRVAINLGNPVLAGLDAAGEPSGISADLSRLLAAQLGGKKADVGFVGAHALHRFVGLFEHAPFNAQAQLCSQFA